MRSLAARQALVALLILATGAAGLALRAQGRPSPAVPPIAALTAGTHWQVVAASPLSPWGIPYRQWVLRDPAGHEALLYVGATDRVQAAARWSGELGYLGEGYVVSARRDVEVGLPGGRPAPAAEATVARLSEVRVVQSAIAGPHGVVRRGPDLAPGAAWDLVRGEAGGYYVVRVSVDGTRPGAGDVAGELLAAALADVSARAESGS
jgi:hypothetical protein